MNIVEHIIDHSRYNIRTSLFLSGLLVISAGVFLMLTRDPCYAGGCVALTTNIMDGLLAIDIGILIIVTRRAAGYLSGSLITIGLALPIIGTITGLSAASTIFSSPSVPILSAAGIILASKKTARGQVEKKLPSN